MILILIISIQHPEERRKDKDTPINLRLSTVGHKVAEVRKPRQQYELLKTVYSWT